MQPSPGECTQATSSWLFIRKLPKRVSVPQLELCVGSIATVVKVVLMHGHGKALVETASLDDAQAVLEYAATKGGLQHPDWPKAALVAPGAPRAGDTGAPAATPVKAEWDMTDPKVIEREVTRCLNSIVRDLVTADADANHVRRVARRAGNRAKAQQAELAAPAESRSSVEGELAVIIPMRGREWQLAQLLPVLRIHLEMQGLGSAHIVVAEQTRGQPYNRGLSINMGVDYCRRRWPECAYVCLHDVDMSPTSNADYSCTDVPMSIAAGRLLRQPLDSASIEDEKMRSYCMLEDQTLGVDDVPLTSFYEKIRGSGGVMMCPLETYVAANGHSNKFWGWGGEDVDFRDRLETAVGAQITYRKIGTFNSLDKGCHMFTPFGFRWCRLNGHETKVALDSGINEGFWHGPGHALNSDLYDQNVKILLGTKQCRKGGDIDLDGIQHLPANILSEQQVEGDCSYVHLVFEPTNAPTDLSK